MISPIVSFVFSPVHVMIIILFFCFLKFWGGLGLMLFQNTSRVKIWIWIWIFYFLVYGIVCMYFINPKLRGITRVKE